MDEKFSWSRFFIKITSRNWIILLIWLFVSVWATIVPQASERFAIIALIIGGIVSGIYLIGDKVMGIIETKGLTVKKDGIEAHLGGENG